MISPHRSGPKDPVVEWLESMNIPVTRENYIDHNWPGNDMPDEWTGEHEAQLPRELQKRSQFEERERR
jgi:hypothetical protein